MKIAVLFLVTALMLVMVSGCSALKEFFQDREIEFKISDDTTGQAGFNQDSTSNLTFTNQTTVLVYADRMPIANSATAKIY
jgi:hypothetical protein